MEELGTTEPQVRRRGVRGHLRRHGVAYVALAVAVGFSPLPSYAAATIGTAQIKNGAVTTKKLANGAVKRTKVANNTINGAKIADGSVAKADLAAAARGFTSVTVKRELKADLANANDWVFSIVCPEGQVAIGGGGGVNASLLLTGATDGTVTRTHPIIPGTNILDFPDTFAPGDGVVPQGWRTVVLNDTGETRNAFGYAICASK